MTCSNNATWQATSVRYYRTVTARHRWRGAWEFIKALPSLFRVGSQRLYDYRITAVVVRGKRAQGGT